VILTTMRSSLGKSSAQSSRSSGLLAGCSKVFYVQDDFNLWRRITDSDECLEWDSMTKRHYPRPDPPSIQVDPNGLSAYCVEHLVSEHTASPEIVLTPKHTLVFLLRVSDARRRLWEVSHSPPPGVLGPPDCSHVLVQYPVGTGLGKGNQARNERRNLRFELSRAMELIHGTIRTPPPPGA
jgi:hypothetical protein